MAVVVENGSQVANSDSYVSRADYIAYAASIGVTIADDENADYQLIKAAEYIDSHEPNLKGTLVDRDQSMAFPRTDLFIEGWSWSSTEIPRQVILAQKMYALMLNDGEDLYNRDLNPNTAVQKERIEGAIEVVYQHGNVTQNLSKNSKADAIMATLLRNNGLSMIMERA